MEKLLNEIENAIYKLIDYKSNAWKDEDKARLIRERIRKEVKARNVANESELLSILQKEAAEKKAAEKKEREVKEAVENAKENVKKIIRAKYTAGNICAWPTKSEAEKLIRFAEFGKLTQFARDYFFKNKMSYIFDFSFPYRYGEHTNFYGISKTKSKTPKIITEQHDNWNVYSKRTKYPAHDYSFMLYLPKNYSFAKIGGLITMFKGRKIDRAGMEVIWSEQSRGMDLKEIEGYLVRGFHIPKTEKINTLEKAIAKVQKQRSATAKTIREKRFWKVLTKGEIAQKLETVWITEADSIAAGNCPAGTASFKNRYQEKNNFGNVGAVRGDELIKQANGEIYFIRKIFAHKFGINV